MAPSAEIRPEIGYNSTEMHQLTPEEIQRRRDRNYHRHPELALGDEAEAGAFIDEVGFCFLFTVAGLELPSLWEAVNGRSRPIPHHHNDHALHLTWRWKDSLPVQGHVYYGKLLRGKPTLVSLAVLPYFYALTDNLGELADFREAYELGRLSEEARRIGEVLLERGPCSTGVLRRESSLWGEHHAARFDRALAELQAGLFIAKCGIAQDNRWKYAYVYDLLPRWLPQETACGAQLQSRQAMAAIIQRYLETVVVSTSEKMAHLFGWSLERTERVLKTMATEEQVAPANVEGVAMWTVES